MTTRAKRINARNRQTLCRSNGAAMTHTPGPWQSMPTEKWVALGGNQPSSVCHVGDYTIATSDPSYEFHGMDENDARLIAAAPQLLKELEQSQIELEEAAKILEPTFPGMASILRHAVTVHRAAITKATGAP